MMTHSVKYPAPLDFSSAVRLGHGQEAGSDSLETWPQRPGLKISYGVSQR
jgi:hypothetical protein